MRQYYYELHWEQRAEIEQNTLFAENLEVAIEFFEALYLDLHLDTQQQPEFLVLRCHSTKEELLRYALHWDAVPGGGSSHLA
jgi:hypothetical protein